MTILTQLRNMLRSSRRPAVASVRGSGKAMVGRCLAIEPLEDRLVPSLNLPNDPSLFQPVSVMAPLAMHIHASVKIIVDGQQVIIPANVGVFGLSAYPMHTHDSSGLIHMESLVVRSFTLQDFFAIWNTTPSGQAALALLGNAPYITVTDNGTTTVGLGTVPLNNLDSIVITALSGNPSPGAAANQAFVSQLYTDLLHRPADTAGLVSFATALDQGASRLQVIQTIEASAEYRSIEVEVLYVSLLHRAADANGMATFTAFMAAGWTREQVADALLGSGEYFALAGGTNAGFLSAIYNQLLHRAPDPTGIAYFQAQLASGMTRAQIALEILQSQEAETVAVQALYQTYLHRQADTGGLTSFVGLLSTGATQDHIEAIILASGEYFSRA